MSGKQECHASFQSFYDKSSLFLLYGGMRKTLFVDGHPLGGISIKKAGIKAGKAFFDLKEQELEYKDSTWRVKANCGGNDLFNLKMKIGEKVKGATRNNIQFGRDKIHFSAVRPTQLSIGGMFAANIGGIDTNTRLKVFHDQAVEVFTEASVAGGKLGCDMRVMSSGEYKGFVGASFGLPALLPMLSNVHVGSIVSMPDMRPSVGVFGEASVQGVQKTIVGVELFNGPQAVLVGAQFKLDDENSIVAKAGDNGIGHVSFIRKFKGIDLRMGTEINLKTGECGKFGASVKLIH